MKIYIRLISLIYLLLLCNFSYAQSNKEKAKEKGAQAIELMDNGKVDESIKLLEEAQALDPSSFTYPYEIAYAKYLQKDYKEAIKILEKLSSHKDVKAHLYQLLGNSYDNIGKSEKAIQTYEAGLKKFPNSGNLYLEMGIMHMSAKDYNKAISYYEKGIELDPAFPSNYYWAAKLYCSSTEEVWGMIYGEIFMNLERNSKRTEEISKLLYDVYKREIKFISDTSFSVSFSQNATMMVSDPKKMKLPFGVGVYEMVLMTSIVGEKSIDLNSLDGIRKRFLENYYKAGNNKDYPNALFEYQNKVMNAGHMEAYNHWILMKGDPAAFSAWQKENTAKWDSFINWFKLNPAEFNEKNRFYRGQYQG